MIFKDPREIRGNPRESDGNPKENPRERVLLQTSVKKSIRGKSEGRPREHRLLFFWLEKARPNDAMIQCESDSNDEEFENARIMRPLSAFFVKKKSLRRIENCIIFFLKKKAPE